MEAAMQVLADVSGLAAEHPLAMLVLEQYRLYLEGEEVGTMSVQRRRQKRQLCVR